MIRLEQLRQCVAIVPDRDATVSLLASLFDIEPSAHGAIPEFGTIYAMLPVGGQFMQIVQPVQDDIPAARYLAQRGPGFYAVIFESAQGLRARDEAEALGMPVVWSQETDSLISVQFRPDTLAQTLVGVDTAKVPGAWPLAGADWPVHLRTTMVTGIHVFRIAGYDLEAMQRPFRTLFGLKAGPPDTLTGARRARARVGHSGSYVDFSAPAPGDDRLSNFLKTRGPGPAGIEMAVRDLDAIRDRAESLGITCSHRSGGPGRGWAAIDVDLNSVLGLPITAVKAFGDANPWEIDAHA